MHSDHSNWTGTEIDLNRDSRAVRFVRDIYTAARAYESSPILIDIEYSSMLAIKSTTNTR